MQNSSRDGIYCDYCNKHVSGDFIYYSFDFTGIDWVESSHHRRDGLASTADLCAECMGLYEDRVKAVYQPPRSGIVRCDITGEVLSGDTSEYYRCAISQVSVSMSDVEYKCARCDKIINIDDGPCKCASDNQIIKYGRVTSDNDYLELVFSTRAYAEFIDHLRFIRDTGDNKWTTN